MEEIRAESFRILEPGGFCYHYIQPTIHAAWRDREALGIDYLRISRFWWDALFANPISYENPLRAPEYKELLMRHRFRVVDWRVAVDQDSLHALKSIRVAPEFRRWSDEELATSNVWAIGQKPAG